MEIKFDRTVDDLLDFNLYHMAHSPGERKQCHGNLDETAQGIWLAVTRENL